MERCGGTVGGKEEGKNSLGQNIEADVFCSYLFLIEAALQSNFH